MDKAVLKKFAIESRQDLMQRMENKIKTFYIDEEFSKQQSGDVYILANSKHSLNLSKEEYIKRELLIKRINELGLDQVIEEAAYTWFNRIVAIRYMEIHDYLPLTRDNQSLGIRVLSSKDNTLDPEIMKFTNLVNPDLDINFKKEKYVELKDDNEKFKYILLLVCKKLGRVIPQVFDGITDYIDILIPDNLLNESGFVNKIITEIPEENYEQVEIIGWLYQYYNKTEKDRVISAKKAYKKNEIPYATQLFTPDWIVKYMVENSLGKYWIEHGGNIDLIKNWKYFIKDNLNFEEKTLTIAEVNKMTVKDLNATLTKKLTKLDPKDIKCIDPCCGSGHILVYMFEVLFQIYESYGYSKKDISKLILENNLYGLDIDDRAGQLSVLSVILKARKYDKNIFNFDINENLNIMSIPETNNINKIMIDDLTDNSRENASYLISNFKDAKEIGSLLLLDSNKEYNDLKKEIENNNTIFGMELNNKLLPVIKCAEILMSKYNVVVTNPPYINTTSMSGILKKYVSRYYSDYKYDLFSAFIKRNSLLGTDNSLLGFMTPNVWMFISSYEKLRKMIIDNMNISSLIQLAKGAFFKEATVDICSFVLLNNNNGKVGNYYRLEQYKGDMEIQNNAFLDIINGVKAGSYKIKTEKFSMIQGMPIVYWADNKYFDIFKRGKILKENGDTRQGMATSDNNKFLRYWYEINSLDNFALNVKSAEEGIETKKKWFPYNKGGQFRKWYGNADYVINYENDGAEVKNNAQKLYNSVTRTIKSISEYFKDCISWSKISSGNIAFRYYPQGFIFDVAGCCIFYQNKELMYYHCAFLNSVIAKAILEMISPTLNYEAGQIATLPIIYDENYLKEVKSIVLQNITISKKDWDQFETSWDFNKHPLVGCNKETIKDALNIWKNECNNRFNAVKENEEKLNEIFLKIYGLEDNLSKKVDDKIITINKINNERGIKSLISYAVGCMFGRYSLDKDGLVYAGGKFDETKYKKFKVDSDNIIPITDETYFDDDIVQRFKQFIEITFGKETLNENLDFIAETLGKKGTETSEETIRRYFVNDFFNDHVKMYQKRPIYWLLDSGKKNGFKALIYMHRYNENLIPKARLDYLHRVQTTYEKLLSDINYKLTTDLSMIDKKEAQKRQADLNAKLQEIKEYDEKIAHIANQRISIDLDDGVKVNYEKFKDILGRIK